MTPGGKGLLGIVGMGVGISIDGNGIRPALAERLLLAGKLGIISPKLLEEFST